jgi:AcrR family transcriptional regulator
MIETRRSSDVRSASPEETRMRILAAARDVIGRKGKRSATTREIADLAGVNEATLFRHFGSKAALIIAVAEHVSSALDIRDRVAALEGPIEEQLLELARVMRDRMLATEDMIRWSLVDAAYEEDLFASTTWRPQQAINDILDEYMAGRVASGELRGDPAKLAVYFMGMIFAHVMARIKMKHSALHCGNPEAALQFYIDVFLNGVRSKSNGNA